MRKGECVYYEKSICYCFMVTVLHNNDIVFDHDRKY